MMGNPPETRSPEELYDIYYGTSDTDHTENNFGGFATLEHALDAESAVYATLSRTVRTADATERFLASDNAMDASKRWVGNPDLDPEAHHQLELGYTRDAGAWDTTASVYYNDVSDYILRDVAAGQPGILLADGAEIYRNVDAELYGLEIEGTWTLRENLELTAALAWVHATNTTDNRPIAQTPPLSGKVQLDYFSGRWTHGGRVRFADSQNRIDLLSRQEVGTTPSWAVLDLYGSYAINDTFSLRYGIDNVFDKTYAEHASRENLDFLTLTPVKVNEPGRVAWLKLTAEF